jgi:hypothetical protein
MLKVFALLTVSATLLGCDIPRPSDVICDCQIEPNSKLSDWRPLDQTPSNFVHSEIRSLFETDVEYMGTPEVFDSASIHWYRNDTGESLACVVYDRSNHVRTVFVLSADKEQTNPIDFRMMGIPFGRDPFFWEGCEDQE